MCESGPEEGRKRRELTAEGASVFQGESRIPAAAEGGQRGHLTARWGPPGLRSLEV